MPSLRDVVGVVEDGETGDDVGDEGRIRGAGADPSEDGDPSCRQSVQGCKPRREIRGQDVPCINPKNLFHFGAKVADHRYCAPTVGSLRAVSCRRGQRLQVGTWCLHGGHLGQGRGDERGPDACENAAIGDGSGSAIAERELEGGGGSLPGALEDEGEVDGRDEVDVSLRMQVSGDAMGVCMEKGRG